MRRESHVRFCESAGVRFPRATRLVRSIKQECLSRVIPFGEREGCTNPGSPGQTGPDRTLSEGWSVE